MSESPIELRGKSGGVVFQGTQSPGGGSPPLASPLGIAGCVLWLDASQLVGLSDDDPIPTWPDLSSSGFDATTIMGVSPPTYKAASLGGLAVARFGVPDSDPKALALTGAALALLNGKPGVSVGAAVRSIANSFSDGQLINAVAGGGPVVRFCLGYRTVSPAQPNAGVISQWISGASNDDTVDALATYDLGGQATCSRTAVAVVAAIDLVGRASVLSPSAAGLGSDLAPSGAFPGTDAVGIQIGGDNTTAGPATLSGDIGELALYDRPLNASEQRQLGEYLSAKWGTP